MTQLTFDGMPEPLYPATPARLGTYADCPRRYRMAYLDRPTNPKEARFSERDYGRFGSYFVTTVTKEKPLLVDYRVWLQTGQMKPEEVAALDGSFVEPVKVKLGK